jgi:hypothetical protein
LRTLVPSSQYATSLAIRIHLALGFLNSKILIKLKVII